MVANFFARYYAEGGRGQRTAARIGARVCVAGRAREPFTPDDGTDVQESIWQTLLLVGTVPGELVLEQGTSDPDNVDERLQACL